MATGVVGTMMAPDITVMYLDMAMRVPMGELRRKLDSPVVVVPGSLFLAGVDSLGYDGKHQIINCRCLSSHSLDFSKHDPNPVNVSLVAAFWISLDESVKLF
jgi:hypothetical protein